MPVSSSIKMCTKSKSVSLILSFLLQIALHSAVHAESAPNGPERSLEAPEENEFSTRRPVVINYFGKVDSTNAGFLARVILDEVANDNRDFHININSTGGDPDYGLAAFNVIASLPISITTFNANEVQSAAIYLYCLGAKRYSYPQSFFMIHSVRWSMENQTMTNIQSKYVHADLIEKRILDIAESCMDIPKAEIRSYFTGNDDNYFDAEEAKSIGIVDEITDMNFIPKKVYLISDDYRG